MNTFKVFRTALPILSMLAVPILGCAHGSVDRRIDDKLMRETNIRSSSDLSNEAGSLIQGASGLTADQRTRLSDLRKKTGLSMVQLADQSLRLRSLLIQDVVSVDYDPEEILALKIRLRDNENRRLTLTFDTIDQANTILDHGAPLARKEFIHSMMMESVHTKLW